MSLENGQKLPITSISASKPLADTAEATCDLVKFGKHRGKPETEFWQDLDYRRELAAQPGFRLMLAEARSQALEEACAQSLEAAAQAAKPGNIDEALATLEAAGVRFRRKLAEDNYGIEVLSGLGDLMAALHRRDTR
jgi:hypothetical protein